jgi:hypothetical protein
MGVDFCQGALRSGGRVSAMADLVSLRAKERSDGQSYFDLLGSIGVVSDRCEWSRKGRG